MILHTIVDLNDIFYQAQNPIKSLDCKNINNIYVEGEYTKQGIRIERLISTDPNDYLKPQYDIGRYLR